MVALIHLALLALPALLAGAPARPPVVRGDIDVAIEGLRSAGGVARVSLFRSAEGFPEEYAKAARTHTARIETVERGKGKERVHLARARFSNLPLGVYAVSVLHDENNNGKVDKGAFGIPLEGFGVSNNPKSRLGPPRFKEATFKLAARRLALTIAMRYMGGTAPPPASDRR